ncbi:MAG: Lrp/AsnC family transcriptional regulator [Pseudomonadota bacterium]
MVKIIDLDDIDKRILGQIQEDATRSIQEIADAVGLSSNPCWRRIRRMEEDGVIKRRVAIVDAAKVGLGATVFVTIRTKQHDSAWLEAFAKGVRKLPEIIECHRMSGDVDYLLKVVVRDIPHYDAVYQRLIGLVPGLGDVSSAFSMESLKEGTAVDPQTIPG